MSEMIERVAKAMQQRAKEPVGNIKSLEPVLVGSLGDTWPYLARAAIEAIREPSKEMIEAAWASALDEDAASVWRNMIDAALK